MSASVDGSERIGGGESGTPLHDCSSRRGGSGVVPGGPSVVRRPPPEAWSFFLAGDDHSAPTWTRSRRRELTGRPCSLRSWHILRRARANDLPRLGTRHSAEVAPIDGTTAVSPAKLPGRRNRPAGSSRMLHQSTPLHRRSPVSRDVPYVDPDSGGVTARVLLLLEAPAGAAAHGSRMLSADNDDGTAADVWRAYAASHSAAQLGAALERSAVVHRSAGQDPSRHLEGCRQARRWLLQRSTSRRSSVVLAPVTARRPR